MSEETPVLEEAQLPAAEGTTLFELVEIKAEGGVGDGKGAEGGGGGKGGGGLEKLGVVCLEGER